MKKISGAALIKEKLKYISHHSGVYRMLNDKGIVLYVGKAKDLNKRLTNYTHPEKLSARIARMVQQTAELIVIETAGETEALLLENDLIKQFRPYYNILLKDDKSFPYIVLTREETPRLMKYRGIRKIKGDYFGPYASGLAVKQSITELQKIFGLRVCNDSYFKNRTRPCLLYQIHRCSGPCVNLISKEAYAASVREAKAFLRGDTDAIQQKMRAQMLELSKNEAFEQAAILRDRILALNRIQDTDVQTPFTQTDIVALYRKGDEACISVFFYRSGRTAGNTVHYLDHLDTVSESDLLSTFLMQFYSRVEPPQTIYTSVPVPKEVGAALSQRASNPIRILSAAKGFRKKLLEQALLNARRSYQTHLETRQSDETAWEELRALLDVPELHKVEVYDNSHIQGAHAVGAMIAATKEGFQKKKYRRFNIQADTIKTNDDFGMMRHVLHRRLSRGLVEKDLPEALIIDGGKGQLSAVLSILDELNITKIRVLAVAKGEERNAGKETLYAGSDPLTPIHLDLKGGLIHLIQRLRDEAHRFAIGSHRMKRAQNMFHESLTDIEGIGQKRKKELMLHFGSPREIAGASLEQLRRVPGISEKIAKKIYTFYHGSL